jgi:hypothetical protein
VGVLLSRSGAAAGFARIFHKPFAVVTRLNQVAGMTALVFSTVQAVARVRNASLAARCILFRRLLVDGEMQVCGVWRVACGV